MSHFVPLSCDTLVFRNDGLMEAEVSDEIVALNVEKGTCYGLNPVGSRIWKLIANPIRVGDICGKLLADYKVEPSECERQVIALLEELRAEGLIAAGQ